MNGLDLFSGIGGITKALAGYVDPVAYCERDRYAVGVLLSRMHSGEIPTAPIWDDVLTLHGAMLPHIDIIYGGFPCQDISVAGRGAGLAGERSGLFFEIARLVSEIRPRFVFLENVAAITVRGAERVVGELCRLGYDCRWGILSASDVGANHQRERWWCLARRRTDVDDSEGRELRDDGQDDGATTWKINAFAGPGSLRGKEDVGDSLSGRRSGQSRRRSGAKFADGHIQLEKVDVADAAGPISTRLPIGTQAPYAEPGQQGWWSTEPNVGRVAHGVPLRVDRLRGLGNAVVPAQAREAFERLIGLK